METYILWVAYFFAATDAINLLQAAMGTTVEKKPFQAVISAVIYACLAGFGFTLLYG